MRQRAFIAAQAADVVGLQEVDVGCVRSGGVDTAAEVLPAGGTLLFAQEAQDADGCRSGNSLWLRPGLVEREHWTAQLDYPDDVWPRGACVTSSAGSSWWQSPT